MLSQSQIQSSWAPRCKGPFLQIALHGKGKVSVRPAIGDATLALDACLRRFGYTTRAGDTGAYVCRAKVGGNGWSNHAFGIALDLNWSTNPYGSKLITDMPAEMVKAICAIRTVSGAQVWNWGGYWRGNKDAMHFEIVCAPRDIASGIRGKSVPAARTTITPEQFRRLVAAEILSAVQVMPYLHPRVPKAQAPWVEVLQKALNVARNAGLTVNGRYDHPTRLHVTALQEDCRRMGLEMRDAQGECGAYTKWWLATAVLNIRDGRTR